MRLFIAIEIPDDLKKMIISLRAEIPDARWVAAEQIHLTLAFLGEVEEAAAEILKAKLASIKLPGFRLNFSGAGCFPNRHRPRVLWVGFEPNSHLEALAAEVRDTVLSCGIPQEERPFSAHITVARLKMSPSPELDAFLELNKKLKFPPYSVGQFTLFQSRLTQQGAVHIPISNFLLN